jgi:hypothetical protein
VESKTSLGRVLACGALMAVLSLVRVGSAGGAGLHRPTRRLCRKGAGNRPAPENGLAQVVTRVGSAAISAGKLWPARCRLISQ